MAKLQSYSGGAYHKYYISDALGSMRFVYNGTTQTYAVQTYKPFGIPYGETGADKVKFAGEMQDSSTGLYYLYKRYFEPQTGRFLSQDPLLGDLATPQTLHRFVYCSDNPLRFTDPTGSRIVGYEDGSAGFVSNAQLREAALNSAYFEGRLPNPTAALDETMYYVGFVPGLDVVADVYFTYRAWQEGDRAGVAIGLGCIVVPGASGSYFRGGKAAVKYFDDAAEWFPESGYRQRLKDLTGVDPGSAFHAHHVFPKEFAEDFFRLGIDVNDPIHLTWMERRAHINLHASGYNLKWKDFLTNANPTTDQAYDYARRLAEGKFHVLF